MTVALTVLLPASLAGTDLARADWAAPEAIPSTPGAIPVAVLPGTGGATYIYGDGPDLRPLTVISRSAAGAYSSARPVLRPSAAPGQGETRALVAAAPHGLVVVASETHTIHTATLPPAPHKFVGSGSGPSFIRAGLGRAGQSVKATLNVRMHSSSIGARLLSAAVNDRGDAAVVFGECHDSCALYAAFRRASQPRWHRIVLSPFTWRASANVVLNEKGAALLAWEQSRGTSRDRDIAVRTRFSSGRLGPIQIAGTTLAFPHLAATLDGHGRGLVVWQSEGVELDARVSQVAANGRIASTRVLERTSAAVTEGSRSVGPGVALHREPDGRATLIWTGISGTHYVVRMQRIPGDAAPVVISDPSADAFLAGFAADSAGRAVVAWMARSRVEPTPPVERAWGSLVVASRHTSSESFGDHQGVVQLTTWYWNGFLLLHPALGPLAVWPGRDSTGDPFGAPVMLSRP